MLVAGRQFTGNMAARAVRLDAATAPTWVSNGTIAETGAAVTTISPGLPASSTAGDYLVLVVCVAVGSGLPTIATPAGYTLITSSESTPLGISVFGKISAGGGESAPSVTLSSTGGILGAAAVIMEFATVHPTVPTEGVTTGTGTSGTSQAVLQVTTLGTNRLCLNIAGCQVAGTGTPLVLWTETVETGASSSNTASIYVQRSTEAVATTTAAGNWTAGTDPTLTVKIAFALRGV